MQTYKYDAFISYRHTEPDKAIAEKLHRMLETYKVPKAVIKMGSQKKVGRVFRDREELPTSSNLADSIQEALENSEHLIVICSPRTPHSQWVCKEIETFSELHGHDRILALLIEGEPEESFPEQLCFVKKCIHHSDGTVTEEFHKVEPLAADIRAQSLSGMKKKLKTEILRLLAPILNCRFDDLKQRHRERKVKRILTLSFALSLFFLLFGSYSAYQASLIKQQAEVIQQKSEQVEQKSKEVEQHAEMLEIQVQKTLRGQSLYLSDIAENYLSNGDRLGAVLAAKEALPKNLANPERPYVEEAEYILCEALGVYKTHYVFELRADLLLRHNEKVLDTALSPDGKKVATLTDASTIYFWNAENGMLLNTYDLHRFFYGSGLHFLDENTLLFHTDKGIHCLDTDTMNEKWSYSCRGSDLTVSHDLSKAALVYSDLVVLDTSKGQPIMDVHLKDILPGTQYPHGSNIVFDESGGCLFFSIDDGAIVKVDLEKKEVAQVFPAAYDYVTGFAISPDGRVAVISFESGADKPYCLNVFDASGDTLYSITSNDSVEDPSFVPSDSDQLIYTSYEDLIILNLRDGTQHICMHGDIVTDYYVFEDLIVTTSYNGSIRFWDAEGSEYTLLRMNLGIYISTLDCVPGMFALESEKEVVLLRPFENNNAILLEGHSELYIEDMIYLEDSRHLVSCSDFGEIILWDL